MNELLVSGNRIYLVDKNNLVIAVDARDGAILSCQSQLRHHQLTALILSHGYIITGDDEEYLHGIKIEKCDLLAKIQVDRSGFRSKLILGNNKIFI